MLQPEYHSGEVGGKDVVRVWGYKQNENDQV